jgi:hypothetical protein
MDTKAEVIEKLKAANNVLVTVSTNPSVDQLAACIGLTLLLNKMNKHATAVFSGEVPSTLEFLQPEYTLEKTTDSLRDFIISLDKSKADKLRYKVEDKLVKIFITPYRTSITDKDLIFSQGDFNVDVVMALGVNERDQLDQAITAHGRILHDAAVISVNTGPGANVGTLHWEDEKASSLSEMVVSISDALKKDVLDAQMATAFLTGIVAETQRFSNNKTTSDTMNASAKLLAAGANQQLVATKLKEPGKQSAPMVSKPSTEEEMRVPEELVEEAEDAGSVRIDHNEEPEPGLAELPAVDNMFRKMDEEEGGKKEKTTEEGRRLLKPEDEQSPQPDEPASDDRFNNRTDSRLMLEPPTLNDSKLTANSEPEPLDPSTDPLTLPTVDSHILSHGPKTIKSQQDESASQLHMPPGSGQDEADFATPVPQPKPPAVPDLPIPPAADNSAPPPKTDDRSDDASIKSTAKDSTVASDESLAALEKEVHSPHASNQPQPPDPDAARAAVEQAMDATPDTPMPKPLEALGAQPAAQISHDEPQATAPQPLSPLQPQAPNLKIDPSTGEISYVDEPPGLPSMQPPSGDSRPPNGPGSPPPVPPPMMPPSN